MHTHAFTHTRTRGNTRTRTPALCGWDMSGRVLFAFYLPAPFRLHARPRLLGDLVAEDVNLVGDFFDEEQERLAHRDAEVRLLARASLATLLLLPLVR